ncbi:hypothetical protein [Aureimonas sp. AU40]|uniref:hypothetical protein n=1 Tax=Aureimonas sp. AU40 TaxID=1637747 RepID=UPI000782C2FE|nr:hypothetical protein [Aureimonas sp. AU40]
MADVEVQDLPQTQLDGFALVEIGGALYRRSTNGFGVDPELVATVEDLSADVVQLFDDVADVREELEGKADAGETAVTFAQLGTDLADVAGDVTQLFDDVAQIREDLEGKADDADVDALAASVADHETRIVTLEAAANVAARLKGANVRTVGPGGDWTTLSAAIAALRVANRDPDARVTVNIAAGIYVENLTFQPGEDWSWVDFFGPAGVEVQPSAVAVSGNSRDYRHAWTVPNGAVFSVGDQVDVRLIVAQSNSAEYQNVGNCLITAVAGNVVTLRVRTLTSFIPANPANYLLMKVPVQVRTSQTMELKGVRSPTFFNVGFRPNGSPTANAAFGVIRVSSGGVLRTIRREVTTDNPRCDLFVCHGGPGITVDRYGMLRGSFSSCNNDASGIIAVQSELQLGRVQTNANGDGCYVIFSKLNQYGNAGSPQEALFCGNGNSGLIGIRQADGHVYGGVALGNQNDVLVDVNARLTVGSFIASVYSPPANTLNNKNSFIATY